ncbi:hypothetical protein TW95_gp1713 [Pandoravirus inopinatum]|uniref:Uncharacterized protein n=1 Tax=Pandoravirus inopinatum TaxID=1605721 RepID=A0A0B5JF35_9VIRU|nr:hypothetical protein TW95_gp1713 [Pandoravirus inopinatum]AJF98447.1 hypothetical protein [Pandoravirus inopinatum]
MDLLLCAVDIVFTVIKWTFVLSVGYLLGNVIIPLCGCLNYDRRCLRTRDADGENNALDTTLSALRVAASLAPDAGFDAATSIIHAARDRTLSNGRLHLYVVNRTNPLAPPATYGAGGPVVVMTLPMMQQRWPRLFDKSDGQHATAASKALALLVSETTETALVVANRLCVGQAILDAEFGPRDDPIVERVRVLVAGVAPP